jgi:hypothetical protein
MSDPMDSAPDEDAQAVIAPAFTKDYLETVRFSESSAAISHLRSLALQNGFKLSARDAVRADCLRLYCHRAEHGKGKKDTMKTGCKFHLTLRREPGTGAFHVMPSSALEHNHVLLEPAAPELSDAIKTAATAMRHVGLERRQIIATIEQMLGHLPTPDQLATILENDNIQPLGTETERLGALMTQLHGSSYIFEVASGERAAVLTITPFEMEMLARFGDVVFLDGTMIRNSLGWTTFPITLITESFEITSGGLLFTAFEDVATFDWLIATLFDVITGTGCSLRTVMTDEDSALVLSMQNFQQAHPEVAHRLCVFHKRRNFQKKVDALTKDPKVQADAIRLFQKIMYSKRRDSVIQAIHQLEHLFPRLHDYIEGEIQDRLQFCSEAFRGGALTLGINHTGSSESANKMLKSSPIGPGFDGIREAHARNHELKISASQAKTTRQFRREHFLERDYQLTLSRALCDKIDSCVARSQKWNVHRKLGHVHWFVATY